MDTEITLVPLDALVPHEKTDKDKVQQLKNDISRTSVIKRPLIIDRSTYTIIDGHHRYEALRHLKARHAPVVFADYKQDIESIRTWPIIIQYNSARLVEIIDAHVKHGPSTLTVIGRNFAEKIRVDAVDAYYTLYHFLTEYCKKMNMRYPQRSSVSVILRPPLSSYEIKRVALHKELLPPKSTKHVTYLKNIVKPTPLTLLF